MNIKNNIIWYHLKTFVFSFQTKLIPLIHHMGGSIRKDMVAKVTHLIANCCGGDKYQYATTFKVPVMSQNWVTACWDQRKDLTLGAIIDSLIVSTCL